MMEVYLSELAESKLLDTTHYIQNKWGKLVRDNFVTDFSNKVYQISKLPKSCPESVELEGLYKCVVSKQSSFYYRINPNLGEIEIITVFDTRQDPTKLKDEIQRV